MAYLTKRKDAWHLHFSVDGRHTTRSLGTVSEEVANKALAELALGLTPKGRQRRNSSAELTHRELHNIWRKSKERARERDIQHSLSFQDFMALYARANGRCEVSGIRFDRMKPDGASRRPWYPSIDRRESSGIYSPENCRIVCVAVNIAMCEWGHLVLKRMAKALVLGPLAAEIPQ